MGFRVRGISGLRVLESASRSWSSRDRTPSILRGILRRPILMRYTPTLVVMLEPSSNILKPAPNLPEPYIPKQAYIYVEAIKKPCN